MKKFNQDLLKIKNKAKKSQLKVELTEQDKMLAELKEQQEHDAIVRRSIVEMIKEIKSGEKQTLVEQTKKENENDGFIDSVAREGYYLLYGKKEG